jgi:hypothetical protein
LCKKLLESEVISVVVREAEATLGAQVRSDWRLISDGGYGRGPKVMQKEVRAFAIEVGMMEIDEKDKYPVTKKKPKLRHRDGLSAAPKWRRRNQ